MPCEKPGTLYDVMCCPLLTIVNVWSCPEGSAHILKGLHSDTRLHDGRRVPLGVMAPKLLKWRSVCVHNDLALCFLRGDVTLALQTASARPPTFRSFTLPRSFIHSFIPTMIMGWLNRKAFCSLGPFLDASPVTTRLHSVKRHKTRRVSARYNNGLDGKHMVHKNSHMAHKKVWPISWSFLTPFNDLGEKVCEKNNLLLHELYCVVCD